MANHMYRVGDYVYFESSPSAPYQIRRIDELNKVVDKGPTSGAVEAKVTCFYRRRDLPNSLLKIADQAERQDQILWRPRRCLLSRHPLASTSNGDDGEAAAAEGTSGSESKENGVPPSNSSATASRKSSPVHAGETSAATNDVKEELSASKSDSAENSKNGVAKAGVDGVKSESSVEDGKAAEEEEEEKKPERSFGFAGLPVGADKLPPAQIHALRQRELFLSRQSETLPASQIRGKCAVVILNEIETCDMYLDREDAFFYSLVYDPANQTLLADKGKIEIGDRHQAEVPEWEASLEDAPAKSGAPANAKTSVENHLDDDEDNKENGELRMVEDGEEDDGQMDVDDAAQTTAKSPSLKGGSGQRAKSAESRTSARSAGGNVPVTNRESLVYHPHHALTDRDIDQFLIIARAVGTFSRALESSSSMKLPSLHLTASAASRDVTLLHAMALLHQANYDIGQATKFLVPPPSKEHYPLDADKATSHNTVSLGGPILCRDQLEEWSAAEATLFEDAIEKYGKDFHDIRVDCLPWKSIRDIVEYYYMWKTTARYDETQKNKTAEREGHLKQAYIPAYNKPNPNMVLPHNTTQEPIKSPMPCESCKVAESLQWYNWGPVHLHLRLCIDCWTVWKKRGGLKCEHEYETYDLDGIGEISLQQQQQQQMSANALAGGGGLRNAAAGNRAAQARGGVLPAASITGIPRTGAAHGGGVLPKGAGVGGGVVPQNLLQAARQVPQTFAQQAAAIAAQANVNNQFLMGPRGRVTFFLNTTLQARIARRMAPKRVLNMRKAARSPFRAIDGKAIQSYYYSRNFNEVLRVARQLRRNRLTSGAVEALRKMHAKHGSGAAGALHHQGNFMGAGGGGVSNGNAAVVAAAAAALLNPVRR